MSSIERIVADQEKFRESFLSKLPSENSLYNIPYSSPETGAGKSQRTSRLRSHGRSLMVMYKEKRDNQLDLVFKGVPVKRRPTEPLTLNPRCMTISTRESRRGIFPPFPSWVLRGGKTIHSAINHVAVSLAYRAVLQLFGQQPKTSIPIAIFRIKSVPVANKNGNVYQVGIRDYFKPQVDRLNRLDLVRLLRYLRIDLEITGDLECSRGIYSHLLSSSTALIRAEVEDLFHKWTPAVLLYAAEDQADRRLASKVVIPERKVNQTKPVMQEQMAAYFSEKGAETFRARLALGRSLLSQLSNVAYYHALGGVLGARKSCLSPKDVTLGGVVLDLHPGNLPGSDRPTYRQFIHKLRAASNKRNAERSLNAYCSGADIRSQRHRDMLITEFRKLYLRKLQDAVAWRSDRATFHQKPKP